MAWLASAALTLLHILYRLILLVKFWASGFRTDPRPLVSPRAKLPSHLALALVPNAEESQEENEKYMINSLEKVVDWCRTVGIPRVSVYDRAGVLANNSIDIRRRYMSHIGEEDAEESSTECDIPYPLPLTPPPSDDADSRPLSPHSRTSVPKLNVTTLRYPTHKSIRKVHAPIKRRRVSRSNGNTEYSPLILHIVSYKSGRAAVAAAASTLLYDIRDRKYDHTSTHMGPSIHELNAVLEGNYGMPSPDLMIVHRKPPAGQMRSPVELDGFLPWQMRLTEIYWNPYPVIKFPLIGTVHSNRADSIEETEFRRALDEFADAEFRLGK